MNSTDRKLKQLQRGRVEKSIVRICVICDSRFQGQRNAYTCSEKCRKKKSRIHKVGELVTVPTLTSPNNKSHRKQARLDGKTWLYRVYNNNGNLLYVGITATPKQRMIDHKKNSVWWDDKRDMIWESFNSRFEAEYAERGAIKQENPVFNIQHSKKGLKIVTEIRKNE